MAVDAAMTLKYITTYGVSATFRTHPEKVYSVDTGKTTPGTATDYAHYVVEGEASESFARVDGVPEADLVLYVASSQMEFVPEVGMEVVYDSKTWVVFAKHRTVYKGVVVLYELALNSKAQ